MLEEVSQIIASRCDNWYLGKTNIHTEQVEEYMYINISMKENKLGEYLEKGKQQKQRWGGRWVVCMREEHKEQSEL